MIKMNRSACVRPTALWGIVLLLGISGSASAVPVFARKYQTSCQTCHTIFPKLNPFGEAFRLNGYQMPAETEEQVKQTPVSLGAEAYARIWPDAVWPGGLPGNAPFAFNVKVASITTHDVKNDFQFPQEANLFVAGTMGRHFGFLGEVTFGEGPDGSGELEIENARLDINSAFGPEHALNFKIGKFVPDLCAGFQEMWIMTDNGMDTLFAYNPIGIRGGTEIAEGAGVSLPGRIRGIEMFGVAKHRLFYTVGVASTIGGGGPNDSFGSNDKKDFYARLDYKFGGMGLDGDTTGVTLPPENWREKSLRVGVLLYTGNGTNVGYDISDDDGNAFKMEDRRYNRTGVYASWTYQDLNVFGVALRGTDRLALLDSESGDFISESTPSYSTWFMQADYVIKPPIQASFRYENLRVGDPEVQSQRFANFNLSFLIRANIKAMLEYHRNLRDGTDYQLSSVVRFAL